jgi:peptidylamidoglycolate lyase
MCNLYLMLYGELPFFMWCVDGQGWSDPEGAGGVPSAAELLPEAQAWAPPVKIAAAPAAAAGAAAGAGGAPAEVAVGQVAGVAGGEGGTLWALFRTSRTWTPTSFHPATHRFAKPDPIRWPTVAQLSRDGGAVLRAWGAGALYMPHMITPDGEGNLWVVDTGLHQALKFSPEGVQLLALGTRLTPGSNESTFCMPTHAVTSRNGTVYVADGYCAGRVVQFTPAGRYQREFALPRRAGAPDPLPHSLALDECKGRMYVADREAGRVLALDLESGEVQGE